MMFDSEGVFQITEEELVQVFSVAFARVLERDEVLFKYTNPQERTFMYRFAKELSREFTFAEDYRRDGKPLLSLDVEYNRTGKGLKHEDPLNSDTHKWIAPDIILHERMSGDLSGENKNRNNIFACEMKRDGSADGKDASRLKSLMKKYRYRFAIDFYKFAPKDNHQFTLYHQGQEATEYQFSSSTKIFNKEPQL